jgi:hypothetical protein
MGGPSSAGFILESSRSSVLRSLQCWLLTANNGRYMGGAFVTFKADKRQALWDRVQGKAGAPLPKGLANEKAEWLKPGLIGRVKFLKGRRSCGMRR